MNVESRVANGEDMIEEKEVMGQEVSCPFGYSCIGILLSGFVKGTLLISAGELGDARRVHSGDSKRVEVETSNHLLCLKLCYHMSTSVAVEG